MIIYRLLSVFILSWILIFLSPIKCITQNLDFEFLHLGKEQGLPANDINAFIYKDSKGFVWISSLSGCYRFDGVNLKHFKIDQNGRYDGMVQSDFWEDNSGDLWLTSYDALHRYNRKKDQIESIQFHQDTITLKSDYHILYFNKSKNIIWLKAEKGFWAYEVKMKTNHTDFFNTKGTRFAIDTTTNGDLKQIYSFTWLPNTGFEIWQKSEPGKWSMKLMDEGILGEAKISNGLIENDSTLWLVSNVGLIEFNTLNRKIRNQFQLPSSSSKGFNSAVFFDENLLVLSTSDNGLWSFDTEEKVFIQNWLPQEDKDGSLFSNQPIGLNVDQTNRLWISYLGKGIDFTKRSLAGVINPPSVQSKKFFVKNIIEDKNKNVLVLTREEGVFVFNLNQELLYNLKETPKGEPIEHLSIDEKEQVWMIGNKTIYKGEYIDGLKRFNWDLVYQGNKKLTTLNHNVFEEKIVAAIDGVYKLIEDDTKLKRVDLFKDYTSMEFNYFFKGLKDDLIIPYNRTNSWFLTSNSKELSFKDSFHLDLLVHQVIHSQDHKHLILSGNKGLFTINEEKELTQILGKDELGEFSGVFSLVRDNNGIIWFTTWRGIWSFDFKTKKLLLAIPWKSMPKGVFYYGPGIKTSDGKLWFEQSEGLYIFDPETFLPPQNEADVYLENIWVNDKKYENEVYLPYLDEIELNYFENNIDFRVNVLDVEFAHKVQLEYRLKNYNDQWVRRKSGELATFTKVPPGEYQFEYRVVDGHNQIGEFKSLSVEILTPFWLAWWFKWLLLFVAFAIIFLFVRNYYNRKLKIEKRALEKQQLIHEERNRIAKELHDDMGGSLTSILYLVNDSLLEENAEHKKQQLERVAELTQNSLSNMRDIIWVLDNDKSTLEDLVHHLHQYSSTYLMDHQISLSFFNDISPHEKKILNSQKKRNIFLIIKEGLHNIVKHANAKLIKLKITTNTEYLKIELVDDGDGFDLNASEDTGFGLSNMRNRSKVVGGTLKLESSLGIGTFLTIDIPL